jgi:hypothetical protein
MGWDEVGREHLAWAARSIEAESNPTASLFDGLGGVALAAWLLSRNGTRYRGLSAALDEALIPLAANLSDWVANQKEGLASHHYDVVSGVSGVGAYLLCRVEFPGIRNALEGLLRGLVALSGEDAGLPRWRTPAALAVDEALAVAYPRGVLNCGLAHGIPGPLALLALAKLSGVEVEGQASAIGRLAGWLAGVRIEDEWGINWPAVVPLDWAAPRGSAESVAAPSPCRPAWCYGSPGVARALWLAGKAIDCPDLGALAVAAMQAAVARPAERRGMPSPTFCHGVAGLLQITLRFATDTGLPVFREAAGRLTAELIAAYEDGTLLGYRDAENNGDPVDNPGLLNGAQGVALTLLAASCAAEPTWDRLCLLS